MRAGWAAPLRTVRSERVRSTIAIFGIVLLMSGQGFHYLIGVPAYPVLCGLTLLAVAISFPTPWARLKPPPLILGFVGLATASIAWSGTRAITAVAVLALLATAYGATAVVRGTSRVEFMVLLYRALQVSVFGAVIFELIVAVFFGHPVTALADSAEDGRSTTWSANKLFDGGPIQGFIGNRNPTAAVALLAAIVAGVLVCERRIRRRDAFLTLGTAMLVLVLTRSATVTVSMVYVLILTVAALAIRATPVRYKRKLSFGILGCTAVAAILTIKYRAWVFGLLERSSEATHRTALWKAVVRGAANRPEGTGFVGPWPAEQQPYADIVAYARLSDASHAHNAFLDAWLQLGIIGVLLLVAMVFQLYGSAWRAVERARAGDSFIPLGWVLLTASLVLQALTESRMLFGGGWFLLVALLTSVPQLLRLTTVDRALLRNASASH